MDKFEEIQLPPKKDYFNTVTGCDISEKNYARANLIWETFGLKNLGELHDLYVASDVLLMTNVMEQYR